MLLIMTLSTSLAAREGPIPMAGHQICIEVWLAVSLLTDALALAGQVNFLYFLLCCAFSHVHGFQLKNGLTNSINNMFASWLMPGNK